ncbi:hypothetical protein VNO78_03835 [Psophocarpus tetragonolobus]|uniref:Uncharacterized protein n=1 Tax=Psophocarpus tetragonolobus TaxID=3891 RepID=A0AAN9XXB0_PSOTE
MLTVIDFGVEFYLSNLHNHIIQEELELEAGKRVMEESTWEQRVEALTHILTSPTGRPSLDSQWFIGTQMPCYLNWDYPPFLCTSNRGLINKWLLNRVLGRRPPPSWRSKCPFHQPPPLILAHGLHPPLWSPLQRRAFVRNRFSRPRRKHINPLFPILIPNLFLFSLLIWNPFPHP